MPTVKFVANPSKGDGMPESVHETVSAHLDHGGDCLDKGKYDDAIAEYDKAIALNPNVALAYTNRGLAYAEKGEVDRAIADYTKAMAIDPNFVLAYALRGGAYKHKGDKEQAIVDYRKALELNPWDQLTKNNLKRLGVTS
jgi:Tfp pilus assembly protein PilF